MAELIDQFDEFTVGLKFQKEWGLGVALSHFLEGTGAGLFLISLYIQSQLLAILGMTIVCVGALVLLLEQNRRDRFWRAFFRPLTSWISRGVFLISALIVLGGLSIVPSMELFAWWPWTPQGVFAELIDVVAGLVAFLVMLYPGFVISSSLSVASWNTGLMPITLFAQSLATGAAVTLALYPLLGDITIMHKQLMTIQVLLIIFCLACILAYLSVMSSSTLAARKSLYLLTRGSFSFIFIGGAIVLGLFMPLVLTGWALLSEGVILKTVVLGITGILKLMGDFVFRYAVLKAGLRDPLI
jgi:formate-dependent nitrite reductase membrane component NrfD